MNDSYHEKIGQLGAFLARADEHGYTFAAADDQRLIRPTDEALRAWARGKAGKTLAVVRLDPQSDLPLLAQLEQAQGDALIVHGLDAWVADPDRLAALNFARESLYDLGKPILFWATRETLSKIGFQAADLFRQRRMTHVFFEEKASDFSALDPALNSRFPEASRTEADYEQLRLDLHLRERHLRDVQQAGLPPARIAVEYALPYATACSELDLHEQALTAVAEYAAWWPDMALKPDQQAALARVYARAKQYEQAVTWTLCQGRDQASGERRDHAFKTRRRLQPGRRPGP